MSGPIVWFDTETAGLLPKHPTIQLAAIVVSPDLSTEIETFNARIEFHEGDADPEALKLNHYGAHDALVDVRLSIAIARHLRGLAAASKAA